MQTSLPQISNQLIELADDRQLEPLLAEAEVLFIFLSEELPLHHSDEEEDLSRLLRLRGKPEDRTHSILAELDRNHAVESFLRRSIIIDLTRIVAGDTKESLAYLFTDLRSFAEGQQRHLAWENEVVLPLAGRRLRPEDLEEMRRNMAARRGLFLSDRRRRSVSGPFGNFNGG